MFRASGDLSRTRPQLIVTDSHSRGQRAGTPLRGPIQRPLTVGQAQHLFHCAHRQARLASAALRDPAHCRDSLLGEAQTPAAHRIRVHATTPRDLLIGHAVTRQQQSSRLHHLPMRRRRRSRQPLQRPTLLIGDRHRCRSHNRHSTNYRTISPTDHTSIPANPPRPRLPTTTNCAPSDRWTSWRAGWACTTVRRTCTSGYCSCQHAKRSANTSSAIDCVAGQSIPGHSETSRSLHAYRATKPTCRREASSNAIAVANSDAGEPSMPTNTGAWAGCNVDGSSSGMIATGQCAYRSSPELTEPRSRPGHRPLPSDPATISSASLERSINVGTAAVARISVWTPAGPPP